MSGHYSMKWDIWQHKGGKSKGWGDEWRGGVWGWAVMVPFWLQIRLKDRLFSDRPLNGDTLWRYMVGNWKAIRDLSLFIQLAHLKKPPCNVNGVSLSLSCVHLTSSSPRSMLSSTRLPHLSSNATEHSKGKVKSSHMDSHGSECKVEFILFLIRTYTGFLFALHKGGKKKKKVLIPLIIHYNLKVNIFSLLSNYYFPTKNANHPLHCFLAFSWYFTFLFFDK